MPDLALLALTLLWGTTFLLVKRALEGTSTAAFLLLRFGVAVLALAGVALVRRARFTRALLWHGVLLGLAMFLGFALQTLGLRYTTPARSGFITGLAAVATPFFARFALGRPVPRSAFAGIALALAGLLLLTRPFGGAPGAFYLGDVLTLACAVAYGFQIVFTSEWSPRHPLAPLVLVEVATTLALAPLLLPLEPWRLSFAPGFFGIVLFTGLGMTALAFFVMAWAQRHTTAVRAALIFTLEPLAAALFSHLVGGEPLLALDWLGGGLMVLGVAVGEVGGALAARPRAAGTPLERSAEAPARPARGRCG